MLVCYLFYVESEFGEVTSAHRSPSHPTPVVASGGSHSSTALCVSAVSDGTACMSVSAVPVSPSPLDVSVPFLSTSCGVAAFDVVDTMSCITVSVNAVVGDGADICPLMPASIEPCATDSE